MSPLIIRPIRGLTPPARQIPAPTWGGEQLGVPGTISDVISHRISTGATAVEDKELRVTALLGRAVRGDGGDGLGVGRAIGPGRRRADRESPTGRAGDRPPLTAGRRAMACGGWPGWGWRRSSACSGSSSTARTQARVVQLFGTYVGHRDGRPGSSTATRSTRRTRVSPPGPDVRDRDDPDGRERKDAAGQVVLAPATQRRQPVKVNDNDGTPDRDRRRWWCGGW